MADIKKVVLAYSGGLDTSIILKWLQTTYGAEVVTFTADLGQGEELEPARKKAEMLGIKEIHIEDLREEFVRDFVFPMFRMNALYEGVYLLGTSIARPLIAKRLVEIAQETGADADRPWRHRQGQRPGPLRADRLRAQPRHQGHRAVARMGASSRAPTSSTSPRRTRSRCRRTSAARRRSRSTPTSSTPRPRARCWRTRGRSRRPTSSSAPIAPEDAPDKRHLCRDRVPEGRPGRGRRQGAQPGDAADRAQRARPRQRHRPARPRREPLRRHEVARHLRDARRHDPPRRAPRDRVADARPRGGAPQGLADAALCGARLLRLLVRARARDAAGAGRQEPGACRGHGAAEALQGQRHRRRPQDARSRSIPTRSSPSRTTAAPTTRRTRPASSGSTRCACARSRRASGRGRRAVRQPLPYLSPRGRGRIEPRKRVEPGEGAPAPAGSLPGECQLRESYPRTEAHGTARAPPWRGSGFRKANAAAKP